MKKIRSKILGLAAFTLTLAFTSCETTKAFDMISTGINAINSFAPAIEKTIDALAEFSPEQEYYIGRAVASSILTQYKLYENETAETYVNNIARTLILQTNGLGLYKNCYVGILDSDELNAFATSGGHILITKGLIKTAGSEDALAAVIAHELAHINEKHSIKAINQARLSEAGYAWEDGAAKFDKLTNKNSKNKEDDLLGLEALMKDMVRDTMDKVMETGYSQSQEFQADEIALSFMAASGYNVFGMQEMLEMIDKNTPKKATGLFKTHPKPQSRLKNLKKTFKKYTPVPTSAVRTARYNSVVKNI